MTRAAAVSVASSSTLRSSPSSSSHSFTHVLVLTSGPPDFGPGQTTLEVSTPENESAIAYYTALGHRARTNHMQVEYVAQGMGHFAAPIVRKLVEPTGGSIYLQKAFNEQFMSDMRGCLFRAIGYNGRVDLYFSSGLKMTRVIGGVSQLTTDDEDDTSTRTRSTVDDDAAAGANETGDSSSVVSHLRLQLSNCRPDESIAIYYALKEDLPQDYVHMQFVFTYTDWNHQTSAAAHAHATTHPPGIAAPGMSGVDHLLCLLCSRVYRSSCFVCVSVRRVSTRRLRTTGNYSTFVRSIDVKVVSMLIVKRLVLLAVQGETTTTIQNDMSHTDHNTLV
jgi:hypothetical protein